MARAKQGVAIAFQLWNIIGTKGLCESRRPI